MSGEFESLPDLNLLDDGMLAKPDVVKWTPDLGPGG